MCRLDPSGGHHLIARPGVKFKFSQTETQKIDFIDGYQKSKPYIADAQQTRELSAFANATTKTSLIKLIPSHYQPNAKVKMLGVAIGPSPMLFRTPKT